MREIINFNSEFISLEKVNPLITKYRINMCVPDIVAKGYIFSKSIIESMSNTIKGAGVYAYYFENEQQIGGHEDDVVWTNRGYKRTKEPVAYGFSDPYQEPYWLEINNKLWYCTDVYLWTGRNPEIEEALTKPVWQSMEVAVNEEPDNSGNKIVKEAIFLGFCLLQGIQPAFDGSKIEKLSLPISTDELNLLKQEYEQFTNKNQIDLQVENELESAKLSINENNKDNEVSDTNDLTTLNINTSSETEEFSNNNNQEKEEGEKVSEEIKFSLNSDQIREIFRNTLSEYKYIEGIYEYNRYYVECYDAEYAYIYDYKDQKTYRMVYQITDDVATIDIESAQQVITGGYMLVGQEQETAQMSEEEVKNEESTEEVTASSNEFVDNVAMQELNEKSAEDNKELAEENLENPEEVNASGTSEDKDTVIMSLKQDMSDLQEKFSKMESDLEVYTSENTKLKEFKASIEKQNKEFAVETTLKEVLSILPSEEIDTCRLSAEKFSLDDIDIWKNEVKAKAFNFSKGIPEKKPFIQVAFPNSDKPKSGTGLWD